MMLEKLSEHFVCFRDDLVQVFVANEAFRVKFADVLRARWAGSEPSVLGGDLQPTYGGLVTRGFG